MPNINKVVYGNTTLIDLTDSTLSSADQLMQGVTAYDRSGSKITGTGTGGGTAAISIVDTPDSHGGDIRTITALDISDTTAVAADVAQGKYFYTSNGTKTAGTASGGDNVLVVTLDWDDTEEMWVPDKTFSEISAAYAAEKTITVQSAYPDQMVVADGFWNEEVFIYFVFYSIENDVIGAQVYLFSEEDLSLVETASFIHPSDTINISQSGNTDVTQYETAYVPSALWGASISEDCRFATENGVRKWLCIAYKWVNASGWIDTSQSGEDEIVRFNAVPANTTINPSTQAQTVGGANYMMEGPVTVAAMPSGTEGTPTATKGTVSNHAVTVTPSVTNVAGYISGGTHTGTAVSVSASELVSGTLTVDSSGTKDVTNYASASVPSGTAGTPSATKGTVSNHSVSVTPSVTNTTGWITGSTKIGTAVTVSASELVSGSETKTSNGTYDVTNLASLVVAVPIVTYYTGSTAPSSSLGSNGDIYLQTGS